jgi:hypothetical protein
VLLAASSLFTDKNSLGNWPSSTSLAVSNWGLFVEQTTVPVDLRRVARVRVFG